VAEAAERAGIAPMTWRRVEDGLVVRDRSHVALDRLLECPPGTVKRALADDMLMVELVKRRAGVDARGVAEDNAAEWLDRFAMQTRTGSPRQLRLIHGDRSPAVVVPGARRPSSLELVNRVVEQLSRAEDLTPAMRDLVRAIASALPDLAQRAAAEQDAAAAGPDRD
jgi:hypothetical protein